MIEADDRTLVVDPCGAADAFLRTGPDAVLHQEGVVTALADAGFAVDGVDSVVLSHLDGIGMTAAVGGDDRWSPFFPNAKVLLSTDELAHIEVESRRGGRPGACRTDTSGGRRRTVRSPVGRAGGHGRAGRRSFTWTPGPADRG